MSQRVLLFTCSMSRPSVRLGLCQYHSRSASADHPRLPRGTLWRLIACSDGTYQYTSLSGVQGNVTKKTNDSQAQHMEIKMYVCDKMT